MTRNNNPAIATPRRSARLSTPTPIDANARKRRLDQVEQTTMAAPSRKQTSSPKQTLARKTIASVKKVAKDGLKVTLTLDSAVTESPVKKRKTVAVQGRRQEHSLEYVNASAEVSKKRKSRGNYPILYLVLWQ
jgi:hypothetical protein